MVQMKLEGLALIPNTHSQALESITNITNTKSPFLWTTNNCFSMQLPSALITCQRNRCTASQALRRASWGNFATQLWKPWLERPHERWRTLLEVILFQESRRSAFEAVHHRLREVVCGAVCITNIWYACHSANLWSMPVLRVTNYDVPNSG